MMRKRVLLMTIVALSIGLAGGLWWIWNRDGGAGLSPTATGEKRKQAEDRRDDSLPPLLFREMAEQTRREVGITDSPLAQEKGDEYINEYYSYVNDSDVRVIFGPGPPDVRLIKMRFWKPASSGELKRVRVSQARWGSWLNVPLEEGGGNVKEWGGGAVGAKAVRVPVYPQDKETDYMKLGRRYLVRMSVSGDKMYESVVRVPEDIPRGKMYVVDVIGKYPDYAFEGRTLRLMEEQRKYIEGKIKAEPPAAFTMMTVAYFNKKKRKKRTGSIDTDGTFKVRADDLGEMLRVTKKQQRAGVGWLYIRSVKKRNLSLPRDADLVMRPEDLVEFHLKIPSRQINEDLASIGLKVHRDDRVPMSWTNLTTDHKHPVESLQEPSKILKNLKETGKVQMTCVPGDWYVAVLYWPEGTGSDRRERKVIGKITIKDSDAGKTVEVKLLEE
ncbi:MAG: hypothetical protein ACLFWL_18600 [Candidatus Brocadiia bacterium]